MERSDMESVISYHGPRSYQDGRGADDEPEDSVEERNESKRWKVMKKGVKTAMRTVRMRAIEPCYEFSKKMGTDTLDPQSMPYAKIYYLVSVNSKKNGWFRQ